ncbi:phosphoribosyltransferase-like protein [Vibrio parahaemolyticus]|uniref:phosphoribosyltransferase-like protein n=1 Tax=Vibrio parahaemolyticus TaxID=670 RepID=UPI001124B71F|nr:hypothetical protein [Vibrio parahaemolyticus]EGQ9297971.1 hypothetical protein [Vibrio parahaemolyticus]MCX8774046.1 hypothetical protein [Vibrio parahaemolyticus]HCE1836604.1 hypothetical protein [Vibrio parahaemolyticus]HCE1930863.1 hypothetical protein [Vibrio parahaemolyticus]HCE4528495.1 hypothetical protein [Vibrio parahaemolyticus]
MTSSLPIIDIKMNKNIFKILFHLTKKQPWLEDKVDELQELLFSDCNTDEERGLILELLDRFTHVSHERFSALINTLVEDITTDPNLEDKTTQIVAMTGDYSSDSAQFVTYALKAPFEKMKWREHITVTNFQRSYREFNKHGKKHTNIVLVDEFVGSGKTIVERVNTLKKLFNENGVMNINIYVKAIAASSIGVKKAQESDINLTTYLVIEQGISEHNDEAEAAKKLALMDRLESILSTSYKSRELPCRGYGGTESLYTRDDGNTPNSVFPIFWWPFFKDNSARETLLIRAMGDA